MRRRRNPSLGDVNTLLILGGLGVVGYLVYKIYGAGKSVATAAGAAQQSAASGVASAAEWLFPHQANLVQFAPNSSIVLTDGTELTSDLVSGAAAFTGTNNRTQIQFTFGGKVYRTDAQPDETNTYYAVDVSAGNAPPPATTNPSILDIFASMPGGA